MGNLHIRIEKVCIGVPQIMMVRWGVPRMIRLYEVFHESYWLYGVSSGLGIITIFVIVLETKLYMNSLLGPLPHFRKELLIVPVVLPVAGSPRCTYS